MHQPGGPMWEPRRTVAAILIPLCIGLVSTAPPPARADDAPLANHKRKGLSAKSIDDMLALPDPEIDIGLSALLIAKEHDPTLDIPKHLAQLDTMARTLRERLGAERDPKQRVRILGNYIFSEQGFRHAADSRHAELLHFLLAGKKGRTLGLTTLYLSLGERLGLPLRAVRGHNQFLVRYASDGIDLLIDPLKAGAIRIGGEAAALRPTDLTKRQFLARLCGDVAAACQTQWRLADAASWCKRGLAIDRGNADIHYRLGRAYCRQGRYRDAAEAFRQATELEPKHFATWRNLGWLYAKQKKLDDAVQAYRKAAAIYPKNTSIWIELGSACEKKEAPNEAIEAYRQAVAHDPKHVGAWQKLGWICAKQDRHHDALEAFRTVLALKPGSVWAWSSIGWSHEHNGKLKDAARAYKKALDLAPDRSYARRRLARVYGKQGKFDRAADWPPLANHGRKGLTVWSVDEMLRLPDGEVDIGKGALLIAKMVDPNVRVCTYLRKLDAMARELRMWLGEEKDRDAVIQAINKFLFDEYRHTYYRDNHRVDFLHFVLDERRGDCVGLTTLYLSLAERLGLHVQPIQVPRHVFARYGGPSGHANIDPAGRGKTYTDKHYADSHEQQDYHEPFHLEQLSKREFLAVICGSAASILRREQKLRRAARAYQTLLRFRPKAIYGWSGLGQVHVKKDRAREAILAFRKALAISPNAGHNWRRLAGVYGDHGQPDEAVKAYRVAMELYTIEANDHACQALRQGNKDQAKKAKGMRERIAGVWHSIGFTRSGQKQYEQAVAAYRKAIEIDPKRASSWSNLGLVYGKQGKPADARTAYQKALAVDPKYAYAHYNIARQLADEGKSEEAIRVYKKAVEAKPDYSRAWNSMGVQYFVQKRYDEAARAYRKAVEADPGNASAWRNLGWDCGRRAEHDEARAMYEKAVEADREYADGWSSLGWAYSEQGRYRKSLEALQKAADLEPDSARAWCALGLARGSVGEWDEAEVCLRKAVALDPECKWSRGSLCYLLRETKRPKEALKEAHAFLRDSPKSDSAYAEVAWALQMVDEYEAAAKVTEAALKDLPNSALLRRVLAGIREDQERYGEAERCYKKSLELQPDSACAKCGLADVYLEQGQYEKAEALWQEVLVSSPKRARAIAGIGFIRRCQGKYHEAVPFYERAARSESDEAYRHVNVALAYMRIGRFEYAVPKLRHAIELGPDWASHHALLAIALHKLGYEKEAAKECEIAKSMLVDWNSYGRYTLGCYYAVIGQPDEAFDWLRKAVDKNYTDRAWIQRDPFLESIRSDPRFEKLLRHVDRRIETLRSGKD